MNSQNSNSCGCCEGLSSDTPLEVYNRPGLSAIAYRVGDYATFRESLLTALSSAGLPALRQLTSRDNNDFTIALLDASAVVSDVLTFYQERIANESYLSTASEQRSILELARLIGYELRPGVAAGAYLAFTIEEATMSAGQVAISGNTRGKEVTAPSLIQPGTKVQSVPGPNENPQNFETVEKLEARADWNAIRPKMGQKIDLSGANVIVVKGTDNNLKPGDTLLIKNSLILKKIIKIELDEVLKTTALYTDNASDFQVYYNPPIAPVRNIEIFSNKVELNKTVLDNLLQHTWREEDFSTLIQTQGWSVADLTEGITRQLAEQAANNDAVYVFRKRAYPFGHNALKQVTYNSTTRLPNLPSQWTEWNISETPSQIYLDSVYEQILPGSYIAVQGKGYTNLYRVDQVDFPSHTAYGMSAKSTLLTIDARQKWWGTGSSLNTLRSFTISIQSEPLTLVESPIQQAISGDTIMLSGLYLGLKAGKQVMIFGERNDLKGAHASELRALKEVYVVNGFTALVFDKPLAHQYIRKTVTINANVVQATHGETAKEVLGSGDARKVFQKFVLKQPPLTFVSAATSSGTQSTLEIRVNDLLWREVPSLYARGPNEHIYTTRQDDEGKTTVIFGDGKNGARLPTGQENIRATYRKGIGANGLLKANQLSQLISRPLGVKAVTNPQMTGGAQDREMLADARRNATLTIYTLGRIVSLQDYEDFARAFAGISKSLATWTWRGQKRSVHITVAGYNGAAVAPGSDLYNNLLKAIKDAGIPDVPVTLDTYTPRFFRVTASISIHPDYLPDQVMPTVEAKLRAHFSFSERAFGQGVAFSEVVSVIQNVEGVTAVDMDELYRSDAYPRLANLLGASIPRPGAVTPFPAELLTLDSRPLLLKLML